MRGIHAEILALLMEDRETVRTRAWLIERMPNRYSDAVHAAINIMLKAGALIAYPAGVATPLPSPPPISPPRLPVEMPTPPPKPPPINRMRHRNAYVFRRIWGSL